MNPETRQAVRRERKRIYRKVARDLRLLHEGSVFDDRKRSLLTTLDATAAAVLEEYAVIYERLGTP